MNELEENSEVTSQLEESSEESSEVSSEQSSEESSHVYTETYTDYTPLLNQVITNQQIFIGLFVALVTFAVVGLIIHWFIRLMKF